MIHKTVLAPLFPRLPCGPATPSGPGEPALPGKPNGQKHFVMYRLTEVCLICDAVTVKKSLPGGPGGPERETNQISLQVNTVRASATVNI